MRIFNLNITKNQARDTGMAIVLILLLLDFFLKSTTYSKFAIPVLVVNMIIPIVYKPIAVVWLGLSHILGTIVSKILLSSIFFLLVTPMGLVRRLIGIDSLKLKQFKKGNESVMKIRDSLYKRNEIEKVY